MARTTRFPFSWSCTYLAFLMAYGGRVYQKWKTISLDVIVGQMFYCKQKRFLRASVFGVNRSRPVGVDPPASGMSCPKTGSPRLLEGAVWSRSCSEGWLTPRPVKRREKRTGKSTCATRGEGRREGTIAEAHGKVASEASDGQEQDGNDDDGGEVTRGQAEEHARNQTAGRGGTRNSNG